MNQKFVYTATEAPTACYKNHGVDLAPLDMIMDYVQPSIDRMTITEIAELIYPDDYLIYDMVKSICDKHNITVTDDVDDPIEYIITSCPGLVYDYVPEYITEQYIRAFNTDFADYAIHKGDLITGGMTSGEVPTERYTAVMFINMLDFHHGFNRAYPNLVVGTGRVQPSA